MMEAKAQPSNQVMLIRSIKSITQMSKHNHIFVRLRGGQQTDRQTDNGRPSLFRLAPALTLTATLHNERASWELTPPQPASLCSTQATSCVLSLSFVLSWQLLGLGRQLLTSAGQHSEQQGGEPGHPASHQCP